MANQKKWEQQVLTNDQYNKQLSAAGIIPMNERKPGGVSYDNTVRSKLNPGSSYDSYVVNVISGPGYKTDFTPSPGYQLNMQSVRNWGNGVADFRTNGPMSRQQQTDARNRGVMSTGGGTSFWGPEWGNQTAALEADYRNWAQNRPDATAAEFRPDDPRITNGPYNPQALAQMAGRTGGLYTLDTGLRTQSALDRINQGTPELFRRGKYISGSRYTKNGKGRTINEASEALRTIEGNARFHQGNVGRAVGQRPRVTVDENNLSAVRVWDPEAEVGDTATVLTQAVGIGKGEGAYQLIYTPVLPDGRVMDGNQVSTYLGQIGVGSRTAQEVLEADSTQRGGLGIIQGIIDGDDAEAVALADSYGQAKHEYHEAQLTGSMTPWESFVRDFVMTHEQNREFTPSLPGFTRGQDGSVRLSGKLDEGQNFREWKRKKDMAAGSNMVSPAKTNPYMPINTQYSLTAAYDPRNVAALSLSSPTYHMTPEAYQAEMRAYAADPAQYTALRSAEQGDPLAYYYARFNAAVHGDRLADEMTVGGYTLKKPDFKGDRQQWMQFAMGGLSIDEGKLDQGLQILDAAAAAQDGKLTQTAELTGQLGALGLNQQQIKALIYGYQMVNQWQTWQEYYEGEGSPITRASGGWDLMRSQAANRQFDELGYENARYFQDTYQRMAEEYANQAGIYENQYDKNTIDPNVSPAQKAGKLNRLLGELLDSYGTGTAPDPEAAAGILAEVKADTTLNAWWNNLLTDKDLIAEMEAASGRKWDSLTDAERLDLFRLYGTDIVELRGGLEQMIEAAQRKGFTGRWQEALDLADAYGNAANSAGSAAERMELYNAKYVPLRKNADYRELCRLPKTPEEQGELYGQIQRSGMSAADQSTLYIALTKDNSMFDTETDEDIGQMFLTDAERNDLMYAFRTGGPEAAMQLLGDLKDTLLQRRSQDLTQRAASATGSSGLAAAGMSLTTLGSNFAGGMAGTLAAVLNLFGANISPDSPIFDATRFTQTVRNKAGEMAGEALPGDEGWEWLAAFADYWSIQQTGERTGWDGSFKGLTGQELGKFLYNTAMSMGDNFTADLLGFGLSCGNQKLGGSIVQLIMSSEATANKYLEMYQKNPDMDAGWAALMAIADGAIEAASEKWSYQNLMSAAGGGGLGVWAKRLLANSFFEGQEEFHGKAMSLAFSEFLDTFNIGQVEGDISGRAARIMLEDPSLSLQAAKDQASREWMQETFVEFLSGALAGGGEFVGSAAVQTANQWRLGRQAMKAGEAVTQPEPAPAPAPAPQQQTEVQAEAQAEIAPGLRRDINPESIVPARLQELTQLDNQADQVDEMLRQNWEAQALETDPEALTELQSEEEELLAQEEAARMDEEEAALLPTDVRNALRDIYGYNRRRAEARNNAELYYLDEQLQKARQTMVEYMEGQNKQTHPAKQTQIQANIALQLALNSGNADLADAALAINQQAKAREQGTATQPVDLANDPLNLKLQKVIADGNAQLDALKVEGWNSILPKRHREILAQMRQVRLNNAAAQRLLDVQTQEAQATAEIRREEEAQTARWRAEQEAARKAQEEENSPERRYLRGMERRMQQADRIRTQGEPIETDNTAVSAVAAVARTLDPDTEAYKYLMRLLDRKKNNGTLRGIGAYQLGHLLTLTRQEVGAEYGKVLSEAVTSGLHQQLQEKGLPFNDQIMNAAVKLITGARMTRAENNALRDNPDVASVVNEWLQLRSGDKEGTSRASQTYSALAYGDELLATYRGMVDTVTPGSKGFAQAPWTPRPTKPQDARRTELDEQRQAFDEQKEAALHASVLEAEEQSENGESRRANGLTVVNGQVMIRAQGPQGEVTIPLQTFNFLNPEHREIYAIAAEAAMDQGNEAGNALLQAYEKNLKIPTSAMITGFNAIREAARYANDIDPQMKAFTDLIEKNAPEVYKIAEALGRKQLIEDTEKAGMTREAAEQVEQSLGNMPSIPAPLNPNNFAEVALQMRKLAPDSPDGKGKIRPGVIRMYGPKHVTPAKAAQLAIIDELIRQHNLDANVVVVNSLQQGDKGVTGAQGYFTMAAGILNTVVIGLDAAGGNLLQEFGHEAWHMALNAVKELGRMVRGTQEWADSAVGRLSAGVQAALNSSGDRNMTQLMDARRVQYEKAGIHLDDNDLAEEVEANAVPAILNSPAGLPHLIAAAPEVVRAVAENAQKMAAWLTDMRQNMTRYHSEVSGIIAQSVDSLRDLYGRLQDAAMQANELQQQYTAGVIQPASQQNPDVKHSMVGIKARGEAGDRVREAEREYMEGGDLEGIQRKYRVIMTPDGKFWAHVNTDAAAIRPESAMAQGIQEVYDADAAGDDERTMAALDALVGLRTTLGALFTGMDELFAAYPEHAQTPVEIYRDDESESHGYVDENNAIRLNISKLVSSFDHAWQVLQQAAQTILHEGEHTIQGEEASNIGSAPDTWGKIKTEQAAKLRELRPQVDALRQKYGNFNLFYTFGGELDRQATAPEALAIFDNMTAEEQQICRQYFGLQAKRRQILNVTNDDLYQYTTGEIMARAAEAGAEAELAADYSRSYSVGDYVDLQTGEVKYSLAEDPNFRAWFGDSKVRGEDGNPTPVYHATTANFNTFTPQARAEGTHPYFYFSESREYTENFMRLWGYQNQAQYKEAYLSIQNPLDLSGSRQSVDAWAQILSQAGVRLNPEYLTRIREAYGDNVYGWQLFRDDTGEFQDAVTEAGYDGIRTTEKSGDTTWAVFDSRQVKSATDNVGTYDRENPDIRYSLAVEDYVSRVADNSYRYSLNSDLFNEDVDQWVADGMPADRMLRLGTTPEILVQLNVPSSNITTTGKVINHIQKRHQAMTLPIIRQIPDIISNPVYINRSRTVPDRIAIFGTVNDEAGDPVLVILSTTITKAEYKNTDILLVHSAYGKNVDLQGFIDRGVELYRDKNRADQWATGLRLKLPSRSSTAGSDGIVTQSQQNSNGESGQKQSYSLATLDDQYLAAVAAGDMVTAQRLVDQAAEAAMPNSKIRDEDGKLLKTYHGTSERFTVFDMSKGRANMDIQGAFFSPWEDDARGYGPNVGTYYLNITNPADEGTGYQALRRFQGQNGAGVKARNYLIGMNHDGVNNEDMEFIAFYPEQIKSADPVVRDKKGNVIPLSERFNSSNPDIRYSLSDDLDFDFNFFANMGQQQETAPQAERSEPAQPADSWENVDTIPLEGVAHQDTGIRDTMQHSETLRGLVNDLLSVNAGQRVDSGTLTYDPKEIRAIARRIKSAYGSTVNAETLAGNLQTVYTTLAQARNAAEVQSAVAAMSDLAYDVIERAETVDEPDQTAPEIRKWMKGARVYLTSGQREAARYAYGSYGAFKNMLFGAKMTATTDTGAQPLDSWWAEAAEMFPDYFEAGISEGDMVTRLPEIMDQVRRKPVNPYQTGEYGTVDEAANDLALGMWQEYFNTPATWSPRAQSMEERQIRLDGVNQRQAGTLSAQPAELTEAQAQAQTAREEAAAARSAETEARAAEAEARQAQQTAEHREQAEKASTDLFARKLAEERRANRERTEAAQAELEQARQETEAARQETAAARQETAAARQEAEENRKRLENAWKSKGKAIGFALEAYRIQQREKARQSAIKREQLLQKANARERAERAWVRLRQMLETPGKAGFIPKEMEAAVIALLNATPFNYSAKGVRSKVTTLTHDVLETAKAAYEAMSKKEKDGGANPYAAYFSEDVAADFDILLEATKSGPKDTRIKNGEGRLNNEQMNALYHIFSNFLAAVRNANWQFVNGRKTLRQEAGANFVGELMPLAKGRDATIPGPVRRILSESFGRGLLTPTTVMGRFEGTQLFEIWKALRNAENQHIRNVTTAKEFMEQALETYHQQESINREAWKHLNDAGVIRKAEKGEGTNNADKAGYTFTFTDKNGEAFRLTDQECMTIYAWTRREALVGTNHLQGGGITIKQAGPGSKQHTYKLTAGIIAEIINSITQQQKDYVNHMVSFLSHECAEWGNEVTRQLYGFDKFTEEYYLPFTVNKNYVAQNIGQAMDQRLKMGSFTKALTDKASTALEVMGFTEMWSAHVEQMSDYNAFVLPIEDMQQLLNYKEKLTDEEGKFEGWGNAVRPLITQAYGRNTLDYIVSFLSRLNGNASHELGNRLQGILTGPVKGASVTLNARVMLQQAGAGIRAMKLLNPVDVLTGIVSGSWRPGRNYAELKQYAPIAELKEWGYFDTNMSRGLYERALTDAWHRVQDFAGAGASKMDQLNWSQIWNACKREANRTYSQLSSEERMQKAAERFQEVIDKTQVVDSIFQRSEYATEKGVMKIWTAFMSEPIKQYNMLAQDVFAILDGRKVGDKAKVKQGVINLVRSSAAIMLSAMKTAALAAFASAWRGWRDDEKKKKVINPETGKEVTVIVGRKTYWDRFGEAWQAALIDNLSGLLSIYTNILDAAKGGTSNSLVANGLGDAIKLMQQLGKAADGDDKTQTDWYKVGLLAAGTVSKFTGIGVHNLLRDAGSFTKTVYDHFTADTKSGTAWDESEDLDTRLKAAQANYVYSNAFKADGKKVNTGIWSDLLVMAYEEDGGFGENFQRVSQAAIDVGASEDSLMNAFWKKWEPGKKLAQEAAEALDQGDFAGWQDKLEEMQALGFSEETAQSMAKRDQTAIENARDDTEPDRGSGEGLVQRLTTGTGNTDAVKTLYTKRLKAAIAAQDEPGIEQALDLLRQDGVNEDTIRSTVKTAVRDLYQRDGIDWPGAENMLRDWAGVTDKRDLYWIHDEWDQRQEHAADPDWNYSRWGDIDAAVAAGGTISRDMIQRMTGGGYEEADVWSHARSQVRTLFKEGKISAAQVGSLLKRYGHGKSEADLYWQAKEITESGEEGSWSKYDALVSAMDSGNSAAFRKRVDELLAHWTGDDSRTTDQKMASIASTILNRYKAEYVRLYKAGRKTEAAKIAAKLRTAVEALGLKWARYQKTINGWTK